MLTPLLIVYRLYLPVVLWDRQFVLDDKGCVAILAWGLPRAAHGRGQDASRAIIARMMRRNDITRGGK